MDTKQEELHKDKRCILCKKGFDPDACKGKPRDVELCLNFEEDTTDEWMGKNR